jgi:hypothetical protein
LLLCAGETLRGIKKLCNTYFAQISTSLSNCVLHFKIFAMAVLHTVRTEGKFFITKFELEVSFGMSLERDCHKVEVTPSLEGVCHKLYV